jgi:hypothetical protein
LFSLILHLRENNSKQTRMTNFSTPVKIVVSLLAVAALVATRFSFNKVSKVSNRT